MMIDTLTTSRAAVSCLHLFPVIQKMIADAQALKNETVRAQVLEVIRCGLENADDSCSERSYQAECKLMGGDAWFMARCPNRAAYWEYMFFGSAQAMSCHPRDLGFGEKFNGHAVRWLTKRGLQG